MSTYAISDVHGCFDQLRELLDVISPTDDDEVWMLGDLIDRGPQSAEVLLWATNEAPGNVHFLLGNHEDMAGCVIRRDPRGVRLHDGWGLADEDVWSYNGGWETSTQLVKRTDVDWRVHVLDPWLRELVPFAPVKVGDTEFMLVHAGFDPRAWDKDARFVSDGITDGFAHTKRIDVGCGFGTQWEQDMVWARRGWYDYEGDLPLTTIFGHTPTTYLVRDAELERILLLSERKSETSAEHAWWYNVPRELGRIWHGSQRVDIDCGCAYRGRLAALRLDDMEEFYVDGLVE